MLTISPFSQKSAYIVFYFYIGDIAIFSTKFHLIDQSWYIRIETNHIYYENTTK